MTFADFGNSFREGVLTTLCQGACDFYETSRKYAKNGAFALAARQRTLGDAYVAAAVELGWRGVIPTRPGYWEIDA